MQRYTWTMPAAVVLSLLAVPMSGADGFITVRDGRFIDSAGRQFVPHGINVGGKHKSTNYMSSHTREDFARMRQWGFNCVRLLVIWAAIEPNCGTYDEDYLRRIDERVAWAKANDLYVLIDMHQDLWGEGCSGGDGAPAWATLDEGRPDRRLGVVWSDGYLVSPKIQTAFDNFWANKPGPDGVGIQDRFALAWGHVAKRFADEPAVIGYDLLNEPFIGSGILVAQAMINRKLMEVFGAEGGATAAIGFVQMLADPKRRPQLYERLSDVDAYRSVTQSAEPVFQQFERTKLGPMYQRVANAIRRVDKRHILFIEPSASANSGVTSGLEPVVGPDGTPDPLQAFAPHAYDIVTDMSDVGSADEGRIQFIMGRLQTAARRLKMPMLIGEWGAFPNKDGFKPAARAMVRAMEDTLAGNTYWYADRHIERHRCFEMLRRPYPRAVAGRLVSYRLDPATGTFECRWTEEPQIKTPSQIYVPSQAYPNGFVAELTPAGKGHSLEPIGREGSSGYVSVVPVGESVERRITIRHAK